MIFGQGEAHRPRCFGCGVSSRLPRGHYCHGCCPMERALGTQAACSLFTSAPEGQHPPTPVPQAKPAVVLLFLLQLHFLWDFIVHVLLYSMWMCRTAKASDSKENCAMFVSPESFFTSVQHQILAGFSNHSHYSCLFSTASPRDSHPLH